MTDLHPNEQRVLDVLRADPEPLIEWATIRMAALGAKSEWSMEDNFHTTESLAELAGSYGLPSAGNQDDDDLRFWGEIALAN